jgi:hypothetical protein
VPPLDEIAHPQTAQLVEAISVQFAGCRVRVDDASVAVAVAHEDGDGVGRQLEKLSERRLRVREASSASPSLRVFDVRDPTFSLRVLHSRRETLTYD